MVISWSYYGLIALNIIWSHKGHMANIYDVTFVKRAKNRLKMLKLLAEGEKTQAELHKITGLYRTHTRRTVNELVSKKLVTCLNPNDRIFKLYRLTKKGKEILHYIGQ